MAKEKTFVIKGDICYSESAGKLRVQEAGYLVCREGISQGVFPELPAAYEALPLHDYSGCLILPGLVDLHVHGPQYSYRGLGMDLELLEWLASRTFPEEAKYADEEYAAQAYAAFTEDLRRGPNTRACVFATIHTPATLILMDQLESSGVKTFVGKVNMDRNAPDNLREGKAREAAEATEGWLEAVAARNYENTAPILTPRFVPSCSNELLERLGKLQRRYGLPVQSHLSENPAEVEWVRKLRPETFCYGDAYDRYGLFGGSAKTVMAHCVYSTEEEIALLKKRGVFIAHCPQSNMNLSSGIAPIRRYLTEGIPMGLGSDVAGGASLSIFRAMAEAIQVSKLRWRLTDAAWPPLSVPEAFYLGTLGGGAFFGRVGGFEPGYEVDALVLEDRSLNPPQLSIPERLERIVYLSDERQLRHKYVAGCLLW